VLRPLILEVSQTFLLLNIKLSLCIPCFPPTFLPVFPVQNFREFYISTCRTVPTFPRRPLVETKQRPGALRSVSFYAEHVNLIRSSKTRYDVCYGSSTNPSCSGNEIWRPSCQTCTPPPPPHPTSTPTSKKKQHKNVLDHCWSVRYSEKQTEVCTYVLHAFCWTTEDDNKSNWIFYRTEDLYKCSPCFLNKHTFLYIIPQLCIYNHFRKIFLHCVFHVCRPSCRVSPSVGIFIRETSRRILIKFDT
jgi:hypothetical protein